MVSGTRTGSKALVQRKAIAKEDPPLVSALAIQDRSSGLASALRSFSARQCIMTCLPTIQLAWVHTPCPDNYTR